MTEARALEWLAARCDAVHGVLRAQAEVLTVSRKRGLCAKGGAGSTFASMHGCVREL